MSSVALDPVVNPDADGLVGSVVDWAADALPSTKWMLADGSAISRSQYSLLFSRLGTLHGSGDGSTTFNLPNLVDKLVRGTDGSAGNEVGTTGGTAAATMPSHTHGPGTMGPRAELNAAAGTGAVGLNSGQSPSTPHFGGSTDAAGGTGDNWPPFVRLRRLIKVS